MAVKEKMTEKHGNNKGGEYLSILDFHRIIEWFVLEGTVEDQLVPTPEEML